MSFFEARGDRSPSLVSGNQPGAGRAGVIDVTPSVTRQRANVLKPRTVITIEAPSSLAPSLQIAGGVEAQRMTTPLSDRTSPPATLRMLALLAVASLAGFPAHAQEPEAVISSASAIIL